MLATPLARPETSTGVWRAGAPLLQLRLSPSWPHSFPPQHTAAPSLVIAQVWCPPAATAQAVTFGEEADARPATTTDPEGRVEAIAAPEDVRTRTGSATHAAITQA